MRRRASKRPTSFAAIALGGLGRIPEGIGLALDAAASDEDGCVRVDVAFARWKLGRAGNGEAEGALLRELDGPAAEAREKAAFRLGAFTPLSSEGTAALLRATTDANDNVRSGARHALWRRAR